MAVNSCNLFDEKAPWSSEADSAVFGETSLTTATELLAAEEAVLLRENNNSRPTPGFDKNYNANSNNDNNNNNYSCCSETIKAVNIIAPSKPTETDSSQDCDSASHETHTELSHFVEDTSDITTAKSDSVSSSGWSEANTTEKHSDTQVKNTDNIAMRLQKTSESESDIKCVTEADVAGNNEAANATQSEEVENIVNDGTGILETQKRTISEESKEGDEQSVAGDEEVIKDPEWIEERFRVDRRKLEQMLQAASDGKGQSGEEFFDSIMAQTNTQITWPSKLKIGAKSKKDPHIKVCGKQADVARAKELTMRVLDTKCTRVTLKMDVSHTEHSHVIGKGGNNIKRVMEETGCHIHFPDSNRNNTAEKSNQVSIAGQPAGVERARSKIRELLPIVVTFDLALSGTVPDPNSTPIQHVVQTYNVSVQFKQRAKAYCTTTCTVRGSNDNVSGLVEGTVKLMQHLAGGTVVPVTSQMEVAPQQHSYMLGRNAANVKHIMQRTGAQIRFPDPNCLPKKSTIYVTGAVEAVIMARQRLMGCLPLVLMFDMKQDDQLSATDEAAKNSQLMESLDIFISIKLKPKQPSKSVIVKSVERNIYNMFEARRQLLKLETTGLKSPPPPASPPPLTLPTASSLSTAGTPLIRLTHAPSPHLKPQYISILPPNGVAIGAIPRPGTPASPLIRQNWAQSPVPVPSPSHSPYPSHQATVAAIHAQQQQHLLLQAQLSAQHLNAATSIASVNASRASSTAGSPPSSQPKFIEPQDRDGSALSESAFLHQMTQQFIKNNRARQQQQQPDSMAYQKSQDAVRTNRDVQMLVNQQQQYADGAFLHSSGGESWADADAAAGNAHANDNISSNVRGLQRHLLEVQSQLMDGNLSANNSFNKGNSDMSLPSHRRSISGSAAPQRDDYQAVNNNTRLAEGMDITGKSYLPVNSGQRQRGHISSHSTPPGSDRTSPMSVLSDRMNEVSVSSPDSVPKLATMHKSPSSSSSSVDLQAALRHLQHSPNKAASYLHPDRAREQHNLVVSDCVKSAYISAAESNNESDLRELTDYFGRDTSPAPPPGFENFPLSGHSPLTYTDYWRQKALQAMRNSPVASEVRIPTDAWSGLYFSRSMPTQEMKKLQAKEQYKQQLATTYEKDDSSGYEDGDPTSANHLAMSQNLANSSRGSSLLSSWRERNSHNLSQSLHSKAGDLTQSLPRRRNHSTFTPEYMSHNIPPPPHPNDDVSPPPQYAGNELPRNGGDTAGRMQSGSGGGSVIKNQPLEAALSLLTNHHLKGPNCVDLHDVLSHLNLEKYSEVFTKQEVDLQTFLTLTEGDLTELGINVFGPRKKILLAIEELNKNRNLLYANTLNAAPGAPSLSRGNTSQQHANSILSQGKRGIMNHGSGRPAEAPSPPPHLRPRDNPSHGSLSSSRLLSNARGMVSQSGRW